MLNLLRVGAYILWHYMIKWCGSLHFMFNFSSSFKRFFERIFKCFIHFLETLLWYWNHSLMKHPPSCHSCQFSSTVSGSSSCQIFICQCFAYDWGKFQGLLSSFIFAKIMPSLCSLCFSGIDIQHLVDKINEVDSGVKQGEPTMGSDN